MGTQSAKGRAEQLIEMVCADDSYGETDGSGMFDAIISDSDDGMRPLRFGDSWDVLDTLDTKFACQLRADISRVPKL